MATLSGRERLTAEGLRHRRDCGLLLAPTQGLPSTPRVAEAVRGSRALTRGATTAPRTFTCHFDNDAVCCSLSRECTEKKKNPTTTVVSCHARYGKYAKVVFHFNSTRQTIAKQQACPSIKCRTQVIHMGVLHNSTHATAKSTASEKRDRGLVFARKKKPPRFLTSTPSTGKS